MLLSLFARLDDRPLSEQPLVQASWAFLRGGEAYRLGLTLKSPGEVTLACLEPEESFLVSLPKASGWTNPRLRWFRAMREGWRETDAAGAAGAGYNEPPDRPGQQTAPAFVAAAEAVALVEMTRG